MRGVAGDGRLVGDEQLASEKLTEHGTSKGAGEPFSPVVGTSGKRSGSRPDGYSSTSWFEPALAT